MSESKSSQSRFPQIIWKVCNLCMSLFFALATYVQVNDPDSAIWMVGYGLPAILCFLIGLKADVTETLPWRRLANLHVLISSAVVGFLGWTMYKKRITNIFQEEEGREFSGLLLTVVWLLLCRNSGRSDVGVGRLFPAVAVTMFPIVSWLYYYINKDLRSSWPSHCNTAI